MDLTVPPIHSVPMDKRRLGSPARLLALGISLTCLAVLVTAALLPPNPHGMNTHTRLGFAPCDFVQRTGLPCPTCGMTTSFSWFVRGNLPASLYVQPMGTVLALLAGVVFWGALYIAATGRPIHRMLSIIPPRYYLLPLLLFATLAWAWKILLHLRGLDGWR